MLLVFQNSYCFILCYVYVKDSLLNLSMHVSYTRHFISFYKWLQVILINLCVCMYVTLLCTLLTIVVALHWPMTTNNRKGRKKRQNPVARTAPGIPAAFLKYRVLVVQGKKTNKTGSKNGYDSLQYFGSS